MSTLNKSLPVALDVLRKCKQGDDNALYDAFIEAGIDKEATLIYWYFLPIIFGRHVLKNSGVRFGEGFICRHGNKSFGPFSFDADARYSHLARVIPECIQQWSNDDVLSVAKRSAEYNVACKLKIVDGDFSGVVCTDTLFVNPTQHFLSECVRRKKWWEFWR
jgi:hypothetical protein